MITFFFRSTTKRYIFPQVNNAGTLTWKPTTEYSDEDTKFMWATNFDSAYHLCQLAHPLLKQSGLANIVFMSSVSGVIAVPYCSPYAATKGNKCLIKLNTYVKIVTIMCVSFVHT